MFQSLRVNSPIYVYYKDLHKLEIGSVTAQPNTHAKYPLIPSTGMMNNSVVDVTAKVNNAVVTYKDLPIQAEIADCYCDNDNVIISTNKEAIASEIITFKQKSIDIINSVDYNKKLITTYDKILEDLNPEYIATKKQQEEINSLKDKVNGMEVDIKSLLKVNNELLRRLGGNANNNMNFNQQSN